MITKHEITQFLSNNNSSRVPTVSVTETGAVAVGDSVPAWTAGVAVAVVFATGVVASSSSTASAVASAAAWGNLLVLIRETEGVWVPRCPCGIGAGFGDGMAMARAANPRMTLKSVLTILKVFVYLV